MAQKLSPEAASAKKKRDLAAAKTPLRKKRKAENQVERRAYKKRGFNLRGKDVHHCPDSGKLILVSVSKNRGSLMVKDKAKK
tara:strand:+ start:290 stop:535 length:246 start_codon:yes stop_codon:yes gene_type:complete